MLLYLNLIDTHEGVSKFEYIYENYKKTMHYKAFEILKDKQLSEDAVHESFIRLIKYINENKIEDVTSNKTKGLVIVIVKRVSINIYNKVKKENEKIDRLQDISTFTDINLETLETFSEIEIAILKLPDTYQEIFLLKFFHQLSDKEISKVLNIRQDTVRKRVSRGRQRLKEILSEGEVSIVG
ncbi:RNA polymerase sigma factor [Romboutsia weinsteinii]|uniref:RNA polymerase sigma factor n=1 Tax=Romboutsia weinsteinii TaxID=2020949 RepID=A0A371J927_9FIRM|nr:RNA polymerase sigma factor [Romboutsia weinsteinii]RDY29234.1 RNA polymerase sigma factor [Romboutsia weinsteinii]